MDMDPFTARMLERARARREKLDKKLVSGAIDTSCRAPLSENNAIPQGSDSKPVSKVSCSATTSRASLAKTEKSMISSPRKSSGTPKKTDSPRKSSSSPLTKQINSPRKSTISPKTPTRTSNVMTINNDTPSKRLSNTPSKKIFSTMSNTVDNLILEINTINNRDDIVLDIQVEGKEISLSDFLKQKKEENSTIRSLPNSNVIVVTSSKNKENRCENKGKQTDDAKADIRDGVKSRLQRLGVLYSDKETLSSPIHRTEQTFHSHSPKQAPPRAPQTDAAAAKTKKFGRLAALADQINNWEDDVTHHQFDATKQKELPPTNTLPVAISTETMPAAQTSPKKQTTGPKPTGILDKRLVQALDPKAPPPADLALTSSDAPPNLHEKKTPTPSSGAASNKRTVVMSKAAIFENAASSSPRQKDPAELTLRERKALFENSKSVALLPKAPFGQALPAKLLNGSPLNKGAGTSTQRAEPPPPPTHVPASAPGGIRGKLAALFTTTTISGREIADRNKAEREREMKMLVSRFQHPDRGATASTSANRQNGEDEEKSPLIGELVEDPVPTTHRKPEIVSNIPKTQDRSACGADRLNAAVKRTDSDSSDSITQQPNKRRSSHDSAKVTSVLDDVKRIRVSGESSSGAATDGRIYPHLSDIETATSSAPEESSECGGSSVDISSEDYSVSHKQQKSSEWGETSFGRDLLEVVRKKHTNLPVHGKYRSQETDDSSSGDNTFNSDLENVLDEALDEDEDDDSGPTPPKINKNVPVASDSFSYCDGHKRPRADEGVAFKSPLKTSTNSPHQSHTTPSLYHSVSLYRKKQNEESKSNTPVRVVKQNSIMSPNRESGERPSRQVIETLVQEKISELQQEVNKQQTIISQASQALNLCAATFEFNQSTEQAEGERLLLLATNRRHALLNEIQRLKVEKNAGFDGPTLSLTIKEITVPLKRDYIRKLNADGAVGHHVVALVKCGARLVATTMKTTAHNNYTISFPDIIKLEDLPANFKVTIEIYLIQASPEILPHDVKYHIVKKTSKFLTPKSKASSSELRTPKIQSPFGPNAVRSTQFQLHGYCIFAMEQVKRTSFSLNKVPGGSPLEGALGVSLSILKPSPPPPSPHSAFLTIFRSVSGLGAWIRRWARVHDRHIAFWTYPDDERTKIPSMTVDLSECVSEKVIVAPRDICARPNTILFDTVLPHGCPEDPNSLTTVRDENGVPRMRYLLAADTKEERQQWLDVLNAALEYARSTDTE